MSRCGVLILSLLLSASPATAAGGQPQYKTSMPIRGIVRALHQASISIDLPVRVAKIHYREAQSFKKGATLVTFDCERLQAEYDAAEAVHREMKLGLDSQSYLDKRGAVGKLDVEISRARADKAHAEAMAIGARLKQCTVVAPFDGRITELKVNEHEVPPSGQPFIGLVEESQYEIDLILPSQALRAIEPGSKFAFTIDETGRTYQATILRLGASVDPVSQSVKVIAGFDAGDGRVLAGMSGSARIPELESVQ